MTNGAAIERPLVPAAPPAPWRRWCLAAAVLAALAALLPPLSTAARQTAYAAALQLSLLAIVVPALVTVGAPWRLLGLSASTSAGPDRVVDRLAQRRRRHRELPRSLAFIVADLVAVVAWHSPRAVEVVARHGWPVLIEAATLLVLGVGLWLELVHSPPLAPRSSHFRRAALSAVVMWVFWILAYILGMSQHAFYPYFTHHPGGLSSGGDQQIAAALSWVVAAATFIPVIFWNARMWLETEDDPDTELMALIQAERRRGTSLGHGGTSMGQEGDGPPPS